MDILKNTEHLELLKRIGNLGNTKGIVSGEIPEKEKFQNVPHKFKEEKLMHGPLKLRNLWRDVKILHAKIDECEDTDVFCDRVIQILCGDKESKGKEEDVLLIKLYGNGEEDKFSWKKFSIQSENGMFSLEEICGKLYLDIRLLRIKIDTSQKVSQIKTAKNCEIENFQINYELLGETLATLEKVISDIFTGTEIIDEIFCDDETDYWFHPMKIIFGLIETIDSVKRKIKSPQG